jgi:hypothetical protein
VNRIAKFASLALAVALIAQHAHAQPAPKRNPETETTKLGTITGRVLADGQAVINASIAVTRVNAATASRFVPTNDNGDFEAKGLDAGAYRVRVSAPGYVTAPSDSDRETYYRVGDSVLLTMTKGGVITGKVIGATDEPVVAVRVRAMMIRDSEGKTATEADANIDRLTDDRGVYRIFGLRPGTYVVYAGGRGSSGYGVNGFDGDAPTYAPSSTRDTAAEISVGSGEEKTIDIRYRADTGHSVSGNAIVPANPNSPWITINLTRLIDGAPDAKFSTYQNSGAKGFDFHGVADGEYLISARYAPTSGETVASEPRRVTVKGADITGIELTAKPLATVAGQFVLEPSTIETCKGKRPLLLDETVVAVQRKQKSSAKAEPDLPVYGSAQATPDKSGNFVLRNLGPGLYDLDVRLFARYWYLRSIVQRTAVAASKDPVTIDATRNLLALKSGDRVSDLKLTLAEGAASLAGQLESPQEEKTSAKLFVYLMPAEKDATDNVLRFFSASVESDGSFAFNNLPPGRYWALAKTANENDPTSVKTLRLPDAAEARAKLRREAEAAKHELELKDCQNMTGYKLLP